ncbi:PH domain-containing protein [Flavobacterium sp.]|uniref:PH domain-containing protein n=1 Tax=Flavobacterium sp. TaxID=239 RepID=UPI0035296C28
MYYDFSKPQRQSVKGIAIMFADTLQGIIRGLWAPILLVIYRFDWSKMYMLVFGLLFLLVLIGFIAYAKYINFTYFLDEEKQEFVIQKGVVTKNKITIQLDKIQQVNINQTVIQKLVGVFSVDIDTAGSNKKEASIRAVDNEVAIHLKNKLLSFEKNAIEMNADNMSVTASEPFLKIGILTLLKVGMTSNYGRSIALLIGFIGTLYGGFQDVVNSFEVDEEEVTGLVDRGLGYFSISFFLMAILIVVLLINLIRTVIKYFDYQMIIQRKALAITHGLFAKKNTLIKPGKVQITTYSQNFFQRKLNLFDLRLKQASSTDETESEGKNSNDIEVPGCSQTEKDAILQMILGNTPKIIKILEPNYRYIIKAIFLRVILPCTLFTGLGLFAFKVLQDYFPIMIIYIFLVGILVFFQFKNYRLMLSNDFITLKGNAWDVQHQIIEPFKIQGITTKQYLWHKRADVVHLTFHTAAGDLSFNFASYSDLKPWINYWLYEVERSNRNWM